MQSRSYSLWNFEYFRILCGFKLKLNTNQLILFIFPQLRPRTEYSSKPQIHVSIYRIPYFLKSRKISRFQKTVSGQKHNVHFQAEHNFCAIHFYQFQNRISKFTQFLARFFKKLWKFWRKFGNKIEKTIDKWFLTAIQSTLCFPGSLPMRKFSFLVFILCNR